MEPTVLPDTALEFTKLKEIFGRLIEAQSGIRLEPGEGWKNHAQILLIKIFRHLESIETIFEGVQTSIGKKTFPHYVDHASIAVLARTAFETYMMFHFIFCAKSELSRLAIKYGSTQAFVVGKPCTAPSSDGLNGNTLSRRIKRGFNYSIKTFVPTVYLLSI